MSCLPQQWRLLPYLAAAYVLSHFCNSFFGDFMSFTVAMVIGDKSETQVCVCFCTSTITDTKCCYHFAVVSTMHATVTVPRLQKSTKLFCFNKNQNLTLEIPCCLVSLTYWTLKQHYLATCQYVRGREIPVLLMSGLLARLA